MQFSSFLRGFVLVRRLIYYTTLSDFCQAFFQSFLKFFLDRGSGSFPVSLDQVVSLFIIPHFKLFVKRFFRFFQIFFSLTRPDSVIFLALCPALRLPSGLAANLFIIPHFGSLVKRLFKISFEFFLSQTLLKTFQTIQFSQSCVLSRPSSFALSSDSFIIIPRFPEKVKQKKLLIFYGILCFFPVPIF